MPSDRCRSNPLHGPSGLASLPSVSAERSDMHKAFRAGFLFGATTLGGCSEGILDPRGPIASAERLLLFNATEIMLVVVIPVIVATLGFAWWYRASNARANRGLEEDYESRVEFVIWSIPALIVILLGGVIWISTHELDPRAPLRS